MQSLTWHPMRSNPLDYLDYRCNHQLVTSDGKPVKITQSGTDFVVTIGDERIVTGSNINTCYVLNQYDVRLKE